MAARPAWPRPTRSGCLALYCRYHARQDECPLGPAHFPAERVLRLSRACRVFVVHVEDDAVDRRSLQDAVLGVEPMPPMNASVTVRLVRIGPHRDRMIQPIGLDAQSDDLGESFWKDGVVSSVPGNRILSQSSVWMSMTASRVAPLRGRSNPRPRREGRGTMLEDVRRSSHRLDRATSACSCQEYPAARDGPEPASHLQPPDQNRPSRSSRLVHSSTNSAAAFRSASVGFCPARGVLLPVAATILGDLSRDTVSGLARP